MQKADGHRGDAAGDRQARDTNSVGGKPDTPDAAGPHRSQKQPGQDLRQDRQGDRKADED